MTQIELPYDVWEVILHMLDGVSIMALACTSHTCHHLTEAFLSRKTHDYWRRLCLRDLSTEDLEFCQSGDFTEDWLSVYKSAHLQNTILGRSVKSIPIPLNPRFIKYRTGLHILGQYLVITQGPVVQVCKALTGKHLHNQNVGNFNVHHSFIIRKSGTEMHTSMKAGVLPCDVLVFVCGGKNPTHIAVSSAHTILTTTPILVACDFGSLPANKVTETSFTCQRFNNRICCGDVSIEISVDKVKGVALKKLADSHCCYPTDFRPVSARRAAYEVVDQGQQQIDGLFFNTNVAVCLNKSDKIVIWSNKRDRAIPAEIEVEGKLWHKSPNADGEPVNPLCGRFNHGRPVPIEAKQDCVRILHLSSGQLLPVLATLQTKKDTSRHVVLYTFPF